MTQTKSLLLYFFAASGILFWLMAAYGFIRSHEDHGRVYNCELAEISPDFPPEVKQECRRLRSGQRI
jgi:hypothetical protein